MEAVVCDRCGGNVVPLSDTSRDGSPIQYKMWVCMSCGKGLVSRGGDAHPFQIVGMGVAQNG